MGGIEGSRYSNLQVCAVQSKASHCVQQRKRHRSALMQVPHITRYCSACSHLPTDTNMMTAGSPMTVKTAMAPPPSHNLRPCIGTSCRAQQSRWSKQQSVHSLIIILTLEEASRSPDISSNSVDTKALKRSQNTLPGMCCSRNTRTM